MLLCKKWSLLLVLTRGLLAVPVPLSESFLPFPPEFDFDAPIPPDIKRPIVRVMYPDIPSKVEAMGGGAVDAVGNSIKGIIGAILHPWVTLYNIGHSVANPIETVKTIGSNIKNAYAKDPYHATGATIANVGMALAPYGWGSSTASGVLVVRPVKVEGPIGRFDKSSGVSVSSISPVTTADSRKIGPATGDSVDKASSATTNLLVTDVAQYQTGRSSNAVSSTRQNIFLRMLDPDGSTLQAFETASTASTGALPQLGANIVNAAGIASDLQPVKLESHTDTESNVEKP